MLQFDVPTKHSTITSSRPIQNTCIYPNDSNNFRRPDRYETHASTRTDPYQHFSFLRPDVTTNTKPPNRYQTLVSALIQRLAKPFRRLDPTRHEQVMKTLSHRTDPTSVNENSRCANDALTDCATKEKNNEKTYVKTMEKTKRLPVHHHLLREYCQFMKSHSYPAPMRPFCAS